MSADGLRRLGSRLALVAFGLLLAGSAVELALRMAGIGRPLELGPLFDREVVSWVPQKGPGGHRKSRRTPLKIAIVGDSFAHGGGNDWGDAYGQRLELLLNLNAATPPAEVRVWAHDGFNTQQELRFLRSIFRWKPQLVILGVFLNDSEDRSDPKNWELRAELMPRVPEGRLRTVLRGSRALGWTWQRLEAMRQRRAAAAYSALVFDPAYSGWLSFERSLDAFAERTRERRVPLVALLFPQLDGVGPYRDALGYQRMLAALTERSIDTLALAPYFEGKSPERTTVYPGIDGHPNEIAHRIAARALLDFLLDHSYVDEAYRPLTSERRVGRDEWLRRVRRFKDPLHFPP
jgi:hypothetical protein